LKRAFTNVLLVALRYILAGYGRFEKLTAKDMAAIVIVQFSIVLMRERPLKPSPPRRREPEYNKHHPPWRP
jgi:hypothetical protein